MWVKKNTPKLKAERTIKYLSASSYMQYLSSPNTFYASRMAGIDWVREPSGLAAMVGTAFDVEVKKELVKLEVPISEGVTLENIIKSLEEGSEFYDLAKIEGRKILARYKMAGITKNLPDLPIARDWLQVEGDIKFTIAGVPIYARLDAVVQDSYTRKPAPFDWKIMGGGSKTGVSPKKGFAAVSDEGQWGKAHKLWDEWDAKSPNSGYEGVNIPMELIDKKWAIQFCIYGWALQLNDKMEYNGDLSDFPVHFDSGVYNGKKRNIKIYTYRAIISKEFQKHLLEQMQAVWRDLTTGIPNLLDRLESKLDIDTVVDKAKMETWF